MSIVFNVTGRTTQIWLSHYISRLSAVCGLRLPCTRDGSDNDVDSLHLCFTGKKAPDNFTMAANVLKISREGLDSAIQTQGRLLQMVDWNPVPYAMQKLPNRDCLVAAETHFNYESSLLPRTKEGYMVPAIVER